MTRHQQLFALLKQGATIITPNNRLSSHILTRFARAENGMVLEKPRCLPWQTYLQDVYRQHVCQRPSDSLPVLINAQQQRFLWTRVIASHLGEPLNQGLVDEIQEAWRRCLQWQLDWNQAAFSLTPQTRQFQDWARQVQTELQRRELIVSEQLVDLLKRQQTGIKPGTVVWYCFDDYTPQQKQWQRYLEEQGCTVLCLDLDETDESAAVYEASDEDDERLQLLSWLQTQLAEGHERIAVVVPDLQNQEQRLQRLLQRHLPASLFDISLGQPLTQFPLVAHALSWLELGSSSISSQQARLILSSPYLGDASREMMGRAQMMHDSAVMQEHRIDYAMFLSELQRYAPGLASLIAAMTDYPKQGSVYDWIQAFTTRLHALGFPGDHSLNSATWQCYHRFLALFDEMKQLAMLSSSLTLSQALSTLTMLARNTVFQPQKTESRIQILGLLEASGCYFDRLWVMSTTDDCLPQKTRLSAFIPARLQRELAMPHACPDRELLLATRIVSRLKNSSRQSVFSYPRLSKDKPNLPSPLLRELAGYQARASQIPPAELALESFTEDYLIPFLPSEPLTGSSSLLADQAKCPFRAFAGYRLQAKRGLSLSDGPNQMERGQIIHRIMELVWRKLERQEHLFTYSEAELDQIIEQAIEQGLRPWQALRTHSFPPLIQAVERQRLRALVLACLDWEKKRPAFTVESLEQSYALELAGITFNLRVDRMDRVANDKKWVIDYKSSLPVGSPWQDERPKEPQILLYALLDERISTMLFGELKAGHMTCKGFSEEAQDLPGIKSPQAGESWQEYREQWRSALHELAEEYQRGHCPPQPVSLSVCQQCDFQSLCRFGMSDMEDDASSDVI
ncbi:PD-(D/E)XK nuclease family protein [Legionella sp. CNM-4043-24]|uniref:PD-(D/E)XK nuclease family protein n=1 Tax=Legionella sp. CNM-4043-24 TaxID=3421646 RepID=UPI00403B0E59